MQLYRTAPNYYVWFNINWKHDKAPKSAIATTHSTDVCKSKNYRRDKYGYDSKYVKLLYEYRQ